MGDKEVSRSFSAEEDSGELWTPRPPMRSRPKSQKFNFIGWGSEPLIEFLQSIGEDTSNTISQRGVTDIINRYIKSKKLIHPVNKKKISCDDELYSLFNKKTIFKLKISSLLQRHFVENQEDLFDSLSSNSEDDNVRVTREKKNLLATERKVSSKRKLPDGPQSIFAAIVPDNLKLVYLKKSLVQKLMSEPETVESKLVGSFVRVKSDPNDYYQKNSHQLVQVTGLKMASETTKIILQASNYVKDISISMLSDDKFSEAECEDVHQRIKDGLLRKLTIVELERKARILHQDITKHWLVGELALLQKLIDRASEKGWRKELSEYLERRTLLQTPDEQSRLLSEIPFVTAEVPEAEVITPNSTDAGIQHDGEFGKSIIGACENGISDVAVAANGRSPTENVIVPAQVELKSLTNRECLIANLDDMDIVNEQPAEIIMRINEEVSSNDIEIPQQPTESITVENSKCMIDKQVIIELSDDEENEDGNEVDQIVETNLASSMWHYLDPQGNEQGPFSLLLLKGWNDARYFSKDFKVWKSGETQDKSVKLTDVLRRWL